MVNSIFSSAAAATTVTWKPVAAVSGGGAAAVFQAKPAQGDSVSVSKLGQALSGVAAEAFSHLDDKAKGVLEGLVNSGQISAEQAVLGLRALATEATVNRYQRERTVTDEEVAFQKESHERWGRVQEASSALGQAVRSNYETRLMIYTEHQRGESSWNEYKDLVQNEGREFHEENDRLFADFRERAGELNAMTADGFKIPAVPEFKKLMPGDDSGDGLMELGSEAGGRIKELLGNLGFDKALFGDAFEGFADTVDIPGLGRKAEPLTGAAASVGETAAATTVAGVSAETATQVATSAATTAAGGRTDADPGGAQAAISLLQGALNAQNKDSSSGSPAAAVHTAGKAAAQADAGLGSLLEALKNGAPAFKVDV